MSIEAAREAAARGAAFLDEKDPGWRDRIVAPLNLREPCDCVVGQDFKDRFVAARNASEVDASADPYVYGLHLLGLEDADDEETFRSEVGLGFVASAIVEDKPGETSFAELQTAWLELLGAGA